MEKMIIEGGYKLEGAIALSGAKNSALPILATSILAESKVDLFNVPTKMEDVRVMIDILKELGAGIVINDGHVSIDTATIKSWIVPNKRGRKIRSSLIFLGLLLAKFGKARVPKPGGCNIGERKFDIHLKGLEALGAKIVVNDKYIEATAPSILKGTTIELPLKTTTGTQNIMLAATSAQGLTKIMNAHTRPEIFDLVYFLQSLGTKIKIIGSGLIEIEGRNKLSNASHNIMYGYDEALTYIVAAAVTKSEIEIIHASKKYLEIPIAHLNLSGVRILDGIDSLFVLPSKRLTPMEVGTYPYPGINSDMQPFLAAFATQAEGVSKITDTRFKNRFRYIKELNKMGANIKIVDNYAIIRGKKKLHGTEVEALDLRGGGALIIASLVAEGKTEINNIYQIDRGYEDIEKKMLKIGAKIKKISE